MTRFVALSVTLHILVGLLLYYGMPSLRRDVSHDYAIVMEIVPVSELTNIKARQAEQRQEETADSSEVKPVSTAPESKQEEQNKKDEAKQEKSDTAAKEEQAEVIPDKKEAKEAKKEEKKEEAKKDSKSKEDKEKDKSKKEHDIFSESFLKNMEAKAVKKEHDKKNKKIFDKLDDAVKADTNKSYNDTMPMSISEIDAIRSQVQKAWNVTAFSNADDKGMQTTLYIKLDMEGNVIEVKPHRAMGSSRYYQAFVDSTVRAVKLASPLKGLPKDKYGSWKEIEFVFDSSGMIY